jgi:hypothetical protein
LSYRQQIRGCSEGEREGEKEFEKETWRFLI